MWTKVKCYVYYGPPCILYPLLPKLSLFLTGWKLCLPGIRIKAPTHLHITYHSRHNANVVDTCIHVCSGWQLAKVMDRSPARQLLPYDILPQYTTPDIVLVIIPFQAMCLCCVVFRYIFPCQQWLATGKGDGQIARELIPYDPSRKKSVADSALEDRGQLITWFAPYINLCDYRSEKLGKYNSV